MNSSLSASNLFTFFVGVSFCLALTLYVGATQAAPSTSGQKSIGQPEATETLNSEESAPDGLSSYTGDIEGDGDESLAPEITMGYRRPEMEASEINEDGSDADADEDGDGDESAADGTTAILTAASRGRAYSYPQEPMGYMEPRTLDTNIANAKVSLTPTDMATAAGHHHHHKHYPHGWLKMGAETGKKGAFKWHDKHPVGGKGRR